MKEVKTEDGAVKKRVFYTTWSESAVYLVDKLTYTEEQYFPKHASHREGPSGAVREVIHPHAISHRELLPFRGKRTKVTIEILE